MEESPLKKRKVDEASTSTEIVEEESTVSEPVQEGQKSPIQHDNEQDEEMEIDTIMHIPKDSVLLEDIDSGIFSHSDNLSPELILKANLAALELNLQSNETLPIRTQFLINSIPLLDNVATQILRIIGVGPYEETLAIITSDEPTAQSLVYRDLVELFEQVKKVYSEDDPFLQYAHFFPNVELLDDDAKRSLSSFENSVDLAIRKANLATFLLSTLGSIEVGFFFLNESFLDVFCPVNDDFFKNLEFGLSFGSNDADSRRLEYRGSTTKFGKLLKVQAALFLELKTQAYISALEAGDRSKEEILEDIFPSELALFLLRRRSSKKLSPAELDFINRAKSRKETLLNASTDEDLSESYDWLIFLKELFSYVSKNIGGLIWGRKSSRFNNLTPFQTTTVGIIDGSNGKAHPYSMLSKEELQQKLDEQRRKEEELNEERERQELDRNNKDKTRRKNTKGSDYNNASTEKDSGSVDTGITSSGNAMTGTGGDTSSAASNSGPPRIRNILRRPWSPDEENALVEALKKVGPYWSKILEHYGAGGSISEALKSRTQVQLKDKARNWKMAYLKNGSEVPTYLAKVTGVIERDDKQTLARRRQKKKLNQERSKLMELQNNNAPDSNDNEKNDKAKSTEEGDNNAGKTSDKENQENQQDDTPKDNQNTDSNKEKKTSEPVTEITDNNIDAELLAQSSADAE